MSLDGRNYFNNLKDIFVSIDDGILKKEDTIYVNKIACTYDGKSERVVDNVNLQVYKFCLVPAFHADIEIATTGFTGEKPNDYSGARAYLSVKPDKDMAFMKPLDIELTGDMELETLIDTMNLFQALLSHVQTKKNDLTER